MRLYPSRRVLLDIPLRVVTFLRALHESADLRGALAEGGYTAKDHDEGVRLLAAVCTYGHGASDLSPDRETKAALACIHRWATVHMVRLRVAVERLHPEHGRLFADLEFSDADSAMLAISRWLERVEALEKGSSADESASGVVALLEQRGAGAAVRSRVRAWVDLVRRLPPTSDARNDDDERELLALHRWFVDWSTTARSVVHRKDWLITLGLAERRRHRGRQ